MQTANDGTTITKTSYVLTIAFYIATILSLSALPMGANCSNIYNVTQLTGLVIFTAIYGVNWMLALCVLFVRYITNQYPNYIMIPIHTLN